MISGDVREFLRLSGVIPSHDALFGREATLPELIARLKKYPVTEWLNSLARMQNMLASDRVGDTERIQRVLCGTVSPEVHEKLKEFEKKHLARNAKPGLYYERQMSTLQQLAVLYAPDSGTTKLDSNDGRHDLSMALLMTMDLMGADRPHTSELESLLPITIQDQIRMATTPAPEYATRAFHLYKLDHIEPSVPVSKFLELFETATGVNAIDCILGGLDLVIREEAQGFEEIANCWHAVPRSHQCQNTKEAEVLAAYEAVRMKPLAELRSLITAREGERPIRDWNLIALSQAPICDLGNMGAFALNHTVLGRSLFDSVRHAILTAALEKRLPEPYSNEQAIGELYGKVFESYIFSVLESAFPGRVYRIPEHTTEQRADLLIWFPDKVVIAEVKGVHFVGLRHASFMSIEERRQELQGIGVPNAVDQLEATVRALRSGDVTAPGMPSYDWTITPIVPVIVTEEQMPWVPGCWDAFYGPFFESFHGLGGAGPLAKLRLLTVDEVEQLPDVQLPHDFATMLFRWAADRSMMELTWGSFLSTQDVTMRREFIRGRIIEVMKFLTRRLDLDESQLAFLEEEQGEASD